MSVACGKYLKQIIKVQHNKPIRYLNIVTVLTYYNSTCEPDPATKKELAALNVLLTNNIPFFITAVIIPLSFPFLVDIHVHTIFKPRVVWFPHIPCRKRVRHCCAIHPVENVVIAVHPKPSLPLVLNQV